MPGGAAGLDGTVTVPDPLPAGWTTTVGYGESFASFVAPRPSDGGAVESSAPAPLVQQFGRPTSGTCNAAAPKDLDWAGVASGGWGESWAWWMNGGKGGAVCNRVLAYSPRGMWVVQ